MQPEKNNVEFNIINNRLLLINTCFLNKFNSRFFTFCGCFYLLFVEVRFTFFIMEGIFWYSKIEYCNLPVFSQTLLQPNYQSYSFFIKSIIPSAFITLFITLFYFCNNSGFKIIAWGGISSASNLLKTSSPCRNANASYGDLLFSFFLPYEFMWFSIS